MEPDLTIQQVAAATGLSVHTLRYYERCSLIAAVTRAANGHRRYSAQDIRWVEFLTRLRRTGMPIRQMQQYAALVRQHPNGVQERRQLLEAHRRAIAAQIAELQDNLAVIDWKIQHYSDIEANANGLFNAPSTPQSAQ
ncbi:MAG: MerR family transcriptional regulator [Cyanobacteria bacterium P01_A01_bin.135]